MSYKLKRVMSLMIAVFVAFGMMVVGTGEASAASKVKVATYVSSNNGENMVYVGGEAYAGAYNTKTGESVTIKSVKSSDTKIARVKVDKYTYDGKKYKNYIIVGKKPGKVKITIKYKANGKIVSKVKKVTVKEYPNAIQGIEINGKAKVINNDRKFRFDQRAKKSLTKASVKIIPAEGWNITDVYADKSYIKNDKYKSVQIKGAKSKVKNGKQISFEKKYTDLWMNVTLSNGTDTFTYTVDLWR